jgi:hypothetical protein
VGFLERLRSYLEHVEREPEGLPVIRVDVAAHLVHFAEASDAMRARDARLRAARRVLPEPLADVAPDEQLMHEMGDAADVERQIRETRESLPMFLEEVADRILETVAPSASQEEVTRLINIAINWELWGGDDSTTGSRGLDEEIGRVAEQARSRLAWRRLRDGWESPSRYAFEIRAIVRTQAIRHTLTRSGAVLLELPGIDAVRWLLALESAQSLGPADEWRISSELAAQLLAEPRRGIEVEELLDGSWRYSLHTIRRLDAMKLLQYEGQDLARGKTMFSYSVFDRARPLLEEIAEHGPGVPIEHRHAIPEPGVTLRPGGSGQGLALVWQVVVGEMLGSAVCGDSPLGGARFEIAMPVKGEKDK